MKRAYLAIVTAVMLMFSTFSMADAFQDQGVFAYDDGFIVFAVATDSDPTDVVLPALSCSVPTEAKPVNSDTRYNNRSWYAVAWSGDSFSPRLAQVPIRL